MNRWYNRIRSTKVNHLEADMNSRDNLNLGDEIKNTVQNAFNKKDFKKLNKDVENIVKSAFDEVRQSKSSKSREQDNYKIVNTNSKVQNDRNRDNRDKIYLKPNSSKYAVPVGRVSGPLFTVFGTITSIGFGIAIFVLAILGFSIGSLFHTVAIGLSPFFILSIILLLNGNSIRNRLKRFQKYISIMRGKSYYSIDDLAKATRSSKKFIVKDLNKMIANGMFPQGHIDDEKSWFILTDATYRQYLELQKSIEARDIDQIRLEKNQAEIQKYKSEKVELSPEIRRSIAEGREFVSKIKLANIAILKEEITVKLDRLEKVTGKIFDYVEIHPEKFDEIKKFIDYFLPTTLKLLDGYRKLDSQVVQGENILNSKKEIERTIDTINLAFENLLDDLFQDMTMDISTDISVLETMLAQEGLTGQDMRFKNKAKEDKE